MVHPYEGYYAYDEGVIKRWDSTAIGVYYCGYLTSENKLYPLYIGMSSSDNGIRGRLLDHLREDSWPDVTHFGYQICDTAQEAENLESKEIGDRQSKPKYNKQG